MGETDEERVEVIIAAKRAAARSKLDELRTLHRERCGEKDASLCTDETLLRFLETSVVHDNEHVKEVRVADAATALEKTLVWRAEQGLDVSPPIRETNCCEGCETNPYAHCFFSIGRDQRGWEVLYMCPGRSADKDPSSLTRHMVLTLESIFAGPFEENSLVSPRREKRPHSEDDSTPPSSPPSSPPLEPGNELEARAQVPRFAEQTCILIDLHGLGLQDVMPSLVMKMVPLFLEHYPDRVAQVAILDAPWMVDSLWGMITPLLDDLGKMKCRMLRGEAMRHYFDTFLCTEQSKWMQEILSLNAAPNAAAFPPNTRSLRRSLGPADKFTRDALADDVKTGKVGR